VGFINDENGISVVECALLVALIAWWLPQWRL
jgi:Flp pilus assembly pilin Flp